MSVVITTSLGDITIDLYTDRCPLTSKNFLKLCKIKYYNGCLFHKVEKDFTAQTGDPTGNGNGGDSIYKFLYGDQARFFSDENHPDLKHSDFGTVAMASAGKNMNASQFYITLREDLDYLDGEHTVFGKVEEGHDVLRRINEAYVDEKGRPYKNIRIKHTYILDDPFDDPPQLAELIPDKSPEGKPAEEVADVRLEDDWVPLDEQLQPEQLDELIRDREAHSRAVVLESIGDIPDAEIKPPENVLFVCKLNSVTQDEDLDTIFSRFGNVLSLLEKCHGGVFLSRRDDYDPIWLSYIRTEIIRDYKTGDSLGYAFIEFESKESCEQAYYKMDNALIDDRRIHVDFSQSVAKLWSSYRRGGKNQGNGCFKCGSVDHIAKNCTGSSSRKGTVSKYALKDENMQRGDNTQKSYDMVFDGHDLEAPRHSRKRHREHRPGDDGKWSKGSESSRDWHAEYERRDSRNDRRHNIHAKHEDRSNNNSSKDRENIDTSRRDEKVSRREVENEKYWSRRDGRQEGHRDRRNHDVSYSKSKSCHHDFERTHDQDDHRRGRYGNETKSSRDRDEKQR